MTPNEWRSFLAVVLSVLALGIAIGAQFDSCHGRPRLSDCPSWGVVHVRGSQ